MRDLHYYDCIHFYSRFTFFEKHLPLLLFHCIFAPSIRTAYKSVLYCLWSDCLNVLNVCTWLYTCILCSPLLQQLCVSVFYEAPLSWRNTFIYPWNVITVNGSYNNKAHLTTSHHNLALDKGARIPSLSQVRCSWLVKVSIVHRILKLTKNWKINVAIFGNEIFFSYKSHWKWAQSCDLNSIRNQVNCYMPKGLHID